jgi:SulP family sulfate permease
LRLHRDRFLVAAAVLAVLVLGALYGLLAAIGLRSCCEIS